MVPQLHVLVSVKLIKHSAPPFVCHPSKLVILIWEVKRSAAPPSGRGGSYA